MDLCLPILTPQLVSILQHGRMQAFNAFFGLEESKNTDHEQNYGLSAADDG